MTRTLRPGGLRLYRLEELEGERSLQVAYGHEPESSELVVLLRTGLIVSAIGLDAAAELGQALIDEAELAKREARGPIS